MSSRHIISLVCLQSLVSGIQPGLAEGPDARYTNIAPCFQARDDAPLQAAHDKLVADFHSKGRAAFLEFVGSLDKDQVASAIGPLKAYSQMADLANHTRDFIRLVNLFKSNEDLRKATEEMAALPPDQQQAAFERMRPRLVRVLGGDAVEIFRRLTGLQDAAAYVGAAIKVLSNAWELYEFSKEYRLFNPQTGEFDMASALAYMHKMPELVYSTLAALADKYPALKKYAIALKALDKSYKVLRDLGLDWGKALAALSAPPPGCECEALGKYAFLYDAALAADRKDTSWQIPLVGQNAHEVHHDPDMGLNAFVVMDKDGGPSELVIAFNGKSAAAGPGSFNAKIKINEIRAEYPGLPVTLLASGLGASDLSHMVDGVEVKMISFGMLGGNWGGASAGILNILPSEWGFFHRNYSVNSLTVTASSPGAQTLVDAVKECAVSGHAVNHKPDDESGDGGTDLPGPGTIPGSGHSGETITLQPFR